MKIIRKTFALLAITLAGFTNTQAQDPLMIGRRPHAAFGNSPGDQQMLEYTKAGDGGATRDARVAGRRKARICYGRAQGLADTKVGTSPQALYDNAKKEG